MKTTLFIIFLVLVLAAGFATGYALSSQRQEDVSDNSNCTRECSEEDSVLSSTKGLLLPAYSSKSIRMSVPEGFNVYYNGDPEQVTDPSRIYDTRTVSMAISSSDRPVTLSDINWEQLDLRLTSSNIISDDFIEEQRAEVGQTVEAVTINDFSGYKVTDVLESDIPNKADTGGSVYYLTTTVDGQSWNLIISKQSLGGDTFETAAAQIINSISLTK